MSELVQQSDEYEENTTKQNDENEYNNIKMKSNDSIDSITQDNNTTETIHNDVDHCNNPSFPTHSNNDIDDDDEFGDFDSAPAISSTVDNDIQSTSFNVIADIEQKPNGQSNVTDQSQHSIQDDNNNSPDLSPVIIKPTSQSTCMQSSNEFDDDDDDEFGHFDSAPVMSSIDVDTQSTPLNMISDIEDDSTQIDHQPTRSADIADTSSTHISSDNPTNQEHSDHNVTLLKHDEVPVAFQIADDEDDDFGDFDSAPIIDSVSVEPSSNAHTSLDDSFIQSVPDNITHLHEDPTIAISPRSLGDPTDQLSDLDMPQNNREVDEPVQSEDYLHSETSSETNKDTETTPQDGLVSNDIAAELSDYDSDAADSPSHHQPLQRVDEILSHQAGVTNMHNHVASIAKFENSSHSHNVGSTIVDDPFAILDSAHSVSPLPSLGDSIVFVPSRPSSTLPALDDDRPPLDLSSAVTSTIQSTVTSNVASPRLSLNQQTIFDQIQDDEFDDFTSASSSTHPSLTHSLTGSPEMRRVHTIPEDGELGDISMSVGQSAMNSPPDLSADMEDLDDDDFGDFTNSQSFDARSDSVTHEHDKPGVCTSSKDVSDKATDELIVRTYESELIAVDTFVSPGSTVRTSITRALTVSISQTERPETSADNEDDWGDFDAAPATAEQPIDSGVLPQTAPSADDDDWSDFNEANQSSVLIESSYFAHSAPAQIFPVDFLDLHGQQLHDNIKQKLSTLFSEEIASVNAACAAEYRSVNLSGPPCISCGASTPTLGSIAVKTIPRICWKCGKPLNSSAQSVLGNALVSLPRFRNSATYHSLFVALGLPIPTPTPRLAKNLLKDTVSDVHDEDGLHHSTADDHVDHTVDADEDETNSQSMESKNKISTSSEPESEQTIVELAHVHAAVVAPVVDMSTSRESVAVTPSAAAVSSPRQTPVTSNTTPMVSQSRFSVNNQVSPVSRPSPRVPLVTSPQAATPATSIGSVTRPRTLEDIERMRAEEKAAKRTADKLALEAQIAAKKANKSSAIGGLTGKLSKLGQSLTKITPISKKIDGPPGPLSPPSSISNVTPFASQLDLDSVARAINHLSTRLPDLSWASARH